MALCIMLFMTSCSKPGEGGDPDVGVSGGEGNWITAGVKVISSPAADGNTVAVVDGSSQDLQMRVFDAGTGELRFSAPWWGSRQYAGMGVGSPAVVGDVVVGLQAATGGDTLTAYDANSGDELWSEEGISSFAPFKCGTLLCTEELAEGEGYVLARDPKSGEPKWSLEGNQTFVWNDEGQLVMMGLGTPILSSLDPDAGTARWRVDMSEIFGPEASTDYGWSALVVEGVVLGAVSGNAADNVPGGVVGVDEQSGAVLWNRPGLDLCPMYLKTIALLCGVEGGIRRVNPATGADVWVASQFRYPEQEGPLLGVTANLSHVLGHDEAGTITSFDAETGVAGPSDPAALAWMTVVQEAMVRRLPEGPAESYIGLFDPVPWNAVEAKPAKVGSSADVPEFAGVKLSETQVFIDGDGNLQSVSSAGS